jgi:CHAT domain
VSSKCEGARGRKVSAGPTKIVKTRRRQKSGRRCAVPPYACYRFLPIGALGTKWDPDQLAQAGNGKPGVPRIDPTIFYFFVLPEDDPYQTSPFQGFSEGWFGLKGAMAGIVTLPTDALEPGLAHDVNIARRINGLGAWRWVPVNLASIQALEMQPEQPFAVVFCGTKSVAETVSLWAQRQRIPPLLVTVQEFHDAETFDSIDYAAIKTYISKTVDRVRELAEGIEVSEIEQVLFTWQERPEIASDFPERGHNCLTANHMALRGAGVSFRNAGRFMPANEADYIDAILETAQAVLRLRADVGPIRAFQIAPPQPGLILSSPSLYREVYDWQPPAPAELADPQIFRKTTRLLQRQTGFQLKIPGPEVMRMLESEPAKAILGIRAEETAVHTLAVGLRSASTIAATIRLPPSVNKAAGAIRQFANHARASQTRRRKIGRLFKEVQDKLSEAVGPKIMEFIENYQGDIKLVTDAPLEWLPIRGLPLALRFHTSRITATPGNLMVGELSLPPLIGIRPDDFKEILIITTINSTDRLRELLPQALSQFEPLWRGKLTVRSVEVFTEEKFVETLNLYRGPVLIFDGHGGHDVNGVGTLQIGEANMDVWQLRGRVRVPPIVILSACDTHAADRSHATAANGFLTLGARAVLGTLLPIGGPSAAMFLVV